MLTFVLTMLCAPPPFFVSPPLSVNLVRTVPGCVITFVSYESLLQYVRTHFGHGHVGHK